MMFFFIVVSQLEIFLGDMVAGGGRLGGLAALPGRHGLASVVMEIYDQPWKTPVARVIADGNNCRNHARRRRRG
jgi:hypothetical protein